MATARVPSAFPGMIAIAAIDFGTTCTGYAYYLRKDHGQHINDINVDQAWMGSAEMGLQAPTTVLLDPDKQFHSFGFEAEAKYKSLTLKNAHAGWYYFRHFKMSLHHEPEISRDIMIKDSEGKKMKAIVIFSEAIKYVKKHLLTKLKDTCRDEINLRDIKWVLTVPAIWRNSAKQFMRESASKAGIPSKQLVLALEPESAAIFCKELAVSRSGGVEGIFLRAFDPGERYIVLDLGGGTVDTTAHEVLKDGSLRELHAAAGGPWGGELVNKAFEEFIEKLVTKPVLNTFYQQYTSDWIEFEKEFEKKKRQFSPQMEEVDINFPVDLVELYKTAHKLDLKARVKDRVFKNEVELVRHSMILKPKLMLRFFDDAVKEIIQHIEQLLKAKELKTVSTILLVGGFSESPVISSAVREHFTSMRVIAPGNASAAILKGAVMYGNDSRAIASRISPYTYGVHTRKLFDKLIHDPKRIRKINGKKYVDNAFDVHIHMGENVYVGGESRNRRYTVSNRRKSEVFWKVYQSVVTEPQFCDEEGCSFLGKLTITVPDDLEGERLTLVLGMTCRGTELEASAIMEEYPEVRCEASFDFLAYDVTTDLEDCEAAEAAE